MENIGEILKNARTENKISIEKVSEITRIKIKFLTDIENNKFDDLGGSGYTKAMITTFAKTVGVDQRKLLNIFNEKHQDTHSDYKRKRSIQPLKIMIPTNLLYLIILVILIIVLSITVTKFYKNGLIKLPKWHNNKTEKIEKKEVIEGGGKENRREG